MKQGSLLSRKHNGVQTESQEGQTWTAVSTWLSLVIKSARCSSKNKTKQKANKQTTTTTHSKADYLLNVIEL